MRDFRKIQAWGLADDLVVAVYQASKRFPREEMDGLTSQLRRAAASVAANIVEGSARETHRDYLRFLYIARGSFAETQYFIHLARRLTYLDNTRADRLEARSTQTFACLHGLIQSIQRQVHPSPCP